MPDQIGIVFDMIPYKHGGDSAVAVARASEKCLRHCPTARLRPLALVLALLHGPDLVSPVRMFLLLHPDVSMLLKFGLWSC
jgi:hypothetical protein